MSANGFGEADTTPAENRLTYSVPQAARLLGISPTSCYQRIKEGVIPALRLGTRLVVPKVALDRILESTGPASTTPLEAVRPL